MGAEIEPKPKRFYTTESIRGYGVKTDNTNPLPPGNNQAYTLPTNCISCGANEFKNKTCCYCGSKTNQYDHETDVYKNIIV